MNKVNLGTVLCSVVGILAIRILATVVPISNLDIANIAYTLNTGRKSFNHRFSFRCSSHQEALQIIKSKSFTETVSTGSSQVIFMFTGQGSQYVDMAKDLYEQEQQFKEYFDHIKINEDRISN